MSGSRGRAGERNAGCVGWVGRGARGKPTSRIQRGKMEAEEESQDEHASEAKLK